MKFTLLKHEEEVSAKYKSGLNFKETMKKLHTEAVKSTIENYQNNRVLQYPPPEINKEEQTLSRRSRTGLAKLRSGFCRTLNSYMSRIDQEIQDVCTLCNKTPHNSNHLFNCASNPTTLTIESL